MIEELLTTARYHPKVDPSLGIWSWEIPVYLFFGGLTAGMMLLAAWALLTRKEGQAPFAAHRLALWAPIMLSIGMTTLFLDLEHKLYVWRFYTSLQPTSPMSWGAWILVVIYPISILQLLSTLRQGYPKLAGYLTPLPLVPAILDFSERHRLSIAGWTIPFAAALGIYTGILLSGFSARPFWNSAILGPLFLVSGLSAAAAITVLAARDHRERRLFGDIDIGLLSLELLLILLLVLGLANGAQPQLEALDRILHGEYAELFWGWLVGIGILLPLILEIMGRRREIPLHFIAPLLVLAGGLLLRWLTVELGQLSSWNDYPLPFDPTLLQKLQ